MFDDIMNATVYSTIIVLICCLLSLSMLLNKGNIKKSLIYKCQMFPLYVSSKSILKCCLIVTLTTSILDAFMYGLNAAYVLSDFSAA